MLTFISNNSYKRNPELYHIQGAEEKTLGHEENVLMTQTKQNIADTVIVCWNMLSFVM
jgi:hypothetical protein